MVSIGKDFRLQDDRIDENDLICQTALAKLYEASWKFDRGKNGDLLKTLENRELEKANFRTILRGGMNCKLSVEELDSLLPLFNNNGFVDGPEFILVFYRLRDDYRSKLLSDRVSRERNNRLAKKMHHVKIMEDLEQKVVINLPNEFTKDDLVSSKNKIMEAAVKYDRFMPGAVQLDAFECEFMKPHVFREQLKMVFNIQLTINELSAYLHDFNKDDLEAPKDGSINCGAFLITFFRVGFLEKEKRVREYWAKKRKADEDRERKRREHREALEQKNQLHPNFGFTPADKESVLAKLLFAAKQYDKSMPGAMSMKAFEEKTMPANVFKEQLRMVFNMQVNTSELGALMSIFDIGGKGVINCDEFSKVILSMGIAERDKEAKEFAMKQKRADDARIRRIQRKQAELDSKNTLRVNYNYTEEEFQSAIHKLTEAAWGYDKNMSGAPTLEAFEQKEMEPHVFQEQLKRAFFMKINPQELGAIMHYFDPERTGTINCSNFLKKFFKTGYEERQRRQQLWRQHQRSLIESREKVALEKKIREDNKLALTDMSHDFTEEDFQSAFALLTEGAMKYFKGAPGSVPLDAFDVESLPPNIFKEQLKSVFNVKVSFPQLWALISYFDKEKTGSVNCERFLIQFFRTGYEERNRIKKDWQVQKQMIVEKKRKKREAKEEEAAKLAWLEVDFTFTEEDFDSALSKLIHMCYNFDPRQVGPAGLVAFDAKSLNPAEFREMLKRTFNVKLTPRELGAMVTYFDISLKKVVTCSFFLNSMTQIRVRCEEFKGTKGEAAKINKYHSELKEQYAQRISKIDGIENKPWRQNSVLVSSPLTTKKRGLKKKFNHPTCPVDKFKLRILTASRMGRLDLSTQLYWAEGKTEQDQQRIELHRKFPADPETFVNLMQNDKMEMVPWYPKGLEGTGEVEFFVEGNHDGEPNDADVGRRGDDLDDEASHHSLSEDSGGEQDQVDQQGDPNDIYAYVFPSDDYSYENDSDDARSTSAASASLSQKVSTVKAQLSETEIAKKTEAAELKAAEIFFRLDVIPQEVLSMKNLKELWLCNNYVSTIPSEIGDLRNLKLLSLKNNQLTSLPPEVCLLDKLNTLYLSGNKLSFLPNLFGRLRDLQTLDLANNEFIDFPAVVCELGQLISLVLSGNKVNHLPNTIVQMKCLTLLTLTNCPFTTPPEALKDTPWVDVKGCSLPRGKRASMPFEITESDEDDLIGLIKSRASNNITSKLRRRKKKSGYA